MQTAMSRMQQPAVDSSRLSSRSAFSQQLVSPVSRPAARLGRRCATAPQAFMRGNPCMPFGYRQADQQVLDQMFRQFMGLGVSGTQSAACDFELPLAVDAADEASSYVFRADIPGVLRQDLKVQTKDNKLTIAGKRERSSQPEESSKQRYERSFGKFSRQLRLPEDADCNSIKAKVDNGVLTVTISKLEKAPGVEDVQVDF
ncbi:hypothetical protein WJX74_001804 [Apatococcus lobatus]|uniref:SHSP domain-containing protein n=1 Tax=Apatococcus lobatus TaxID=904363 RepID=A0AAW1RY06_9CHLO